MSSTDKYNVDFSLAIRNRTGKFTIGSLLIEDQKDSIKDVYYWRVRLHKLPSPTVARILDLFTNIELRLRAFFSGRFLPLHSCARRTIHLDPYTTIYCSLGPQDIVIVHDVGPVTNPDLFSRDVCKLYHNAFSLMVTRNARIVFVSYASMLAFKSAYGSTSDMRVIYPPIGHVSPSNKSDAIEKLKKPFLLTVGSIGRRKNQVRCIKAFAESGLADDGYSYVICGAREPGAEEVEALAHNTAGVILLPYVSSAQLAWLYSNAKGFILMSELEGFGMPVAEAILNGLVPLITSNSVLTEVAGQNAISADFDKISEIAKGMQLLARMSDNEKRDRQLSLKNHIAAFSRAEFSKQWNAMLRS